MYKLKQQHALVHNGLVDETSKKTKVKAKEAPSPPKEQDSKFQKFLDSKTTRIIGTIILFLLAFLTAVSLGFIVETIRST